MADIFGYLRARPYPGRGILLGVTPSGERLCAYFIMGRSVNSRNRVFEATGDGVRTRAFDESKMIDPSLIIYSPVREYKDSLIVTNGDQTDTVRDALAAGRTVYDALASRQFEPDPPNFTPRISGIMSTDSYQLSILKTGDGVSCRRFFYNYAALPGAAHFISTYEGFGSPLPPYSGEPAEVLAPDLSPDGLAAALWDALDESNRVSLYVRVGGGSAIINKNIRH